MPLINWTAKQYIFMPSGKKLITTQELKYPSTLSIYKRIANLGLAIATLIIAFNLWFNTSQKEQFLLQEQANQLGRSLLQQASFLMKPPLNKSQQLESILAALTQDPHVHSATLYQATGKLLLGSADNQPLLEQQDNNLLVYIHNLQHDDQIAGFLKLVLYKDKVLAHPQKFRQQQLQRIPFMLFLALLMGILLTRAFYKLKYKHYSVKKEYHS